MRKGRANAAGVRKRDGRGVSCVRLSAAGVAAALLAASSGCAAVVLSEGGQRGPEAAIEREALASAAAAVAETPWPRAREASLAERLVGTSGPSPDEHRLAEIYVSGLSAPRKPVILAAATANIGAARRLAETGEAALTAIRPAMSDVAVIEAAIADMKENRDVYVASLKLVARSGETVDAEELRRLRGAFAEAISDLGKVADSLAERMDEDRSRTFASPAASRFVN